MLALTGVAQWVGHQTANQNVSGSIPSQDTCLGCGPGPQLGACERQPHTDVFSPSLSPSLPLSLKNKYIKSFFKICMSNRCLTEKIWGGIFIKKHWSCLVFILKSLVQLGACWRRGVGSQEEQCLKEAARLTSQLGVTCTWLLWNVFLSFGDGDKVCIISNDWQWKQEEKISEENPTRNNDHIFRTIRRTFPSKFGRKMGLRLIVRM